MENRHDRRFGCPEPSELAEFNTGNLPGNAFQRIAAHVEHCAVCEAALRSLDGQTTHFLSRLRQAAIEDAPTEMPIPQELLSAAQSLHAGRGSPAEESPRQLGKFEILEVLGSGSFGQVFRARDTELGRTVAIKVLRAGRLASREEVDRFMREARSAAQLKHPGLVGLYETGQTMEGVIYLVEEFVEGETLSARLNAARVGFRQAAELIAEVADALDYAHRHGVIHRDVKPLNILLDREGRPHLMDFGLAKSDMDETPMTLDGQFLGTPAYVSPEQARGVWQHVDGRTDIYSLGVVLYELLTGERPFQGNRQMLLLQVLHDEPRLPRQLNDKLPRDLETICLKAMSKSPSRRYATAAELADDLRRFLRGEPIRAQPIGRAARLWRWCRRNPVAAGLLLAVSLSSSFGLWELSLLSRKLVQSSALESAAQQSELLDEVNNLYSAEVVDKLKKVKASGSDSSVDRMIPVPASLTIELGKHFSERNESGVQVRLYSDFPFKSRKDGRSMDGFEREALARLRENATAPFYRFEDFQGRPALRYATARRMQATCVQCHNHHPDRDWDEDKWHEGDVRGVLEIIRPLDQDAARARDGLRLTLIRMAVISGTLVGLSILMVVIGNRRRQPARSESSADRPKRD